MVRVKTSAFSTLKPTDLTNAAQANLDAINNAPMLFMGITPASPMVQTAIDDLLAKMAIAKYGSTIQKNERDAAKAILVCYLLQWAGFISAKCTMLPTEEQQIDLIQAGAFVPSTKGSPIGPLSAVENIRTEPLSNQIAIEWTPKKGAHSYKVMKTEGYATETSVWKEFTVTTRSKVICPSPAGEVMSFAVYPVGAAGIGAVSEYVTGMANL